VPPYEFVTHWEFDAPVERVWDEIYHSERWPEWWKAVREVVLIAPGDSSGVGAIRKFTWRGALPYRLSFETTTTRVEPYRRLEGVASGELSGNGCWYFTSNNSKTQVRYDWKVEASKWWMRLLRPIARPIFEWNHDVVMRWGLEGLTRRLARKPMPGQ
jgi:hypothetical protein